MIGVVSFFKEVLKAKQLESPDDIKSILNQAIEGDYSELDEIVKNIANYKGQFVELDTESFMNFYSQQLHLVLIGSHLYNIFFPYNLNQEKLVHEYCISELLLLAIAANDQLAEKYHEVLFAEENLSLIPLLVGGKQYISEFIKRFPELYPKLKGKTITVSSGQTIGFFSVIAANKYQELLEEVLGQNTPLNKEQKLMDILPDLKLELQKTQEAQKTEENSLYDILEVAVLMENQVFIEKVLKSIEQDISNQRSKDELLLKSSFVTLLATAISQELTSIVEYLCKKCIEHENPVIQKIYQAALSDDKIIEKINEQIFSKILSAEGNREMKGQKICKEILQIASRVNNMTLVTKILDEIESNPQLFTTDKDGKNFLRDSLNAILEHDEGRILIEKRMSAEMDDDVKTIYDEVYKSRKVLDPIREIDTTSTGQKATESNSLEENTMTKEIETPTTESNSRRSSTESISNDSGVGESGGSDSAAEEQPSLTDDESQEAESGKSATENSSRTPESNNQKPVRQVHFPSDSQLELVLEITPRPNSNKGLDAPQLNQDDETPGHKFRIADSLYAKLKAKNEKGEYYENAESGETSRGDLSRDGITINGVTIPAGDIKELYNIYEKNPQNSPITMATSIFTLAFEDVKEKVQETEVPTDSIIQELVINYNQSGYWALIPVQVNSILNAANLVLFENVHKSSINYTGSDCVSIKFEFSGYISPNGYEELCKLNCTLEFKLEATDKGVEYKDVIISLDSSKELEVRYVEVPRDNPEADASEAPKIKVVSLIPEIRKYLSSGVLPGFSTSTKIDVLHNGEVVLSYDKNEKRNRRSKRSTIKNENADQGTVGQHSQSQSNKTYRNALFTTTIATFTVALTATAAASVFTAIYHETMPIKLVEAVGTYSLGIALIAACCLAVTAIIYCCTKPANLLENNNIEGRINSQTVTGS